MDPLWKLLNANDFQKQKLQVRKNNDLTDFEVNKTKGANKKHNIAKDTNYGQLNLFDEKENSAMAVGQKSFLKNSINKINTNLFTFPEFLVFTSLNNVYKIKNRGFKSKTQIIQQVKFEDGEKSIFLTGTKNYSGYLFVAFENGKAGKISFTSFYTEHNRKKLKNAFNNESKVVYIKHIEKDLDLVAISSIGKVVLFNTSKINPVGSRTSKGVQVMKSKDGSYMEIVKRLNQVEFSDPEYYRKDGGLNIVGYYLKQGDEI